MILGGILVAAWLGDASASCSLRIETVDENGRPLPGVTVRLGDMDIVYESVMKYSDREGVVVFDALPDDVELEVRASFPGAVILPATVKCAAQPSVRVMVIEPVVASLVALLADPDAFDHRYVSVTGVLFLEFETDALYLDQGSRKHKILKNSIQLRLSPEMRSRLRARSKEYVSLVGRFNAKAHRGKLFSGSLEDIRWP